jgi:hypothetical protein
MNKANIILDHNHETGKVRGVLCRQCNGSEGKIKKQAVRCSNTEMYIIWLERLLKYLKSDNYNYLHPTHRTEAEKRALRNKRARAKYHESKNKKSPKRRAKLVIREVE